MRTMTKFRSLYFLIVLFILACTGCMLFLNALLIPEEILNFSDVVHVWYFLKTFTVDSWRQTGELPLWNPLIFSGVPFAANPQSTLFYPPFWIFFSIPVHFSITLLFVLHFVFAGLGMYVFARLRRLSFLPSLFAALVFVLNWKVVAHIFAGHLTQTAAWSYFPWLMASIDYFAQKRSVKSMIGVTLCYTLLFLAGHMQLFYYQFLVASAYLLTLTATTYRDKWFGISVRYALCGVFIAVCTAVSLFPVVELTQYFHRAGGTAYSFASSFSMPLKALAGFILPYLQGIPEPGSNLKNQFFWESAVYCGILPIFLSMIGYRSASRVHSLFFGSLFFFSLLFALGANGPLFKPLYYILPGISYFRVPARMFLYGCFSVSILSAFALQALMDDYKDIRLKPLLRIFGILFALMVLAHEYLYYVHSNTELTGSGRTLFYLFCGGLVLLGRYKAWLKNKYLFALIVIFISITDLFTMEYPLITTKPLDNLFPANHIYGGVTNDPTLFRIFDTTGVFPQYMSAQYNVQQIGGDEPVMLGSYLNYIHRAYRMPSDDTKAEHSLFTIPNLNKNIDWNRINLLNVKYLYSFNKIDQPNLIEEGTTAISSFSDESSDDLFSSFSAYMISNMVKIYLYRNARALPRSFVLPIIDPSMTPDDTLYSFMYNNFVGLEPAQILDYTSNDISFKVTMDTSCYLFSSEIYYPGWKVFVDATEADMIVFDGVFRGVKLTEGTHSVEFRFEPASYIIGRRVTSAGVVLLVLSTLVCFSPLEYTKEKFFLLFFR